MKENKEKILIAYIQHMYFDDYDMNEIYKLIYNNKKDDWYKLLKKNFNKKVSEKDFYSVIDRICHSINNEIDDELLDFDFIKKSFIKEYNKKELYDFEKISYALFLFIEKLYYKLVRDSATKVFFFAREGQFLKKLFDIYQSEIVGPKIKSEYLYVSRASTFLGTLTSIDKEEFLALFTQYPNMSLKTFCQNLSFSENEINKLQKELNIDFEKEIINVKESNEYKKLISFQHFINLYNDTRNNAKSMFVKYLEQFGENEKNPMFIVDVGWKGTIQNNIQKIFENKNIKGYYLGLVHYTDIIDYDKKEAVLFENTPKHVSNNGYLYNSNRSIFELLLMADHGSTINYKNNGNNVVPVLNNQKKELDLYNDKIKAIQNNILKKFKNIVTIFRYGFYDNISIEKKMNEKFFKLMFNPSKSELQKYNSFYMYENFGVMNYSTFERNNNVKFVDKMKKYRHFKSFIHNDDSWQYLKLHNNKMFLGKIVLYCYKWRSFKRNRVI